MTADIARKSSIPMIKAIPYYRVSTQRQGRSGLGLEAQQQAVNDFAVYNSIELLNGFIEIESGRKSDRPVLLEALAACKKHHAMLLIARLDRLARNVAFVSSLMESGVAFKAVDNPNAEGFVTHIIAAVDQRTREQISSTTIAALAAAKRRGVVLGKFGTEVLSQRNKERADDFAIKMRPVFETLMQQGFTTVRALAKTLNRRRVRPYSGNGAKWHKSSVHALLKRIRELNKTV